MSRRYLSAVERALARGARQRGLSLVPAGLLSLAIGLLITATAGPPVPQVHDEFSYMLAADTFTRGRLTNPPHPMWRHFETMHVLSQPTYMSKFHPAQGLVLALGQRLFGAAWAGVLLSTSLACMALTWALLGWVRPRWALLGGLLAALHPPVVEWSHMYWGGSVAMAGGALVFGAIGRMLRGGPVPRHATVLALGGAILALSRPFEAVVWAILCGITLVALAIRADRQARPQLIAGILLPGLAVLGPLAGFISYYNWRVTGDPMQSPYLLHARQYMAVPLMFGGKIDRPKTRADYRHDVLADQHLVYEWDYFHGQSTWRGWAKGQWVKFVRFSRRHLLRNPALLLGLIGAALALRGDRRIRLAGAFLGGFLLAYTLVPWFEHHYSGVVMALVFTLALRGLRVVHGWRLGAGRFGRILVWGCAAASVVVSITFIVGRSTGSAVWHPRDSVEKQLMRQPGRHLVIVRYERDHPAGIEWVYNAAEIDSARIVWAREMTPGEDRALIEYYPQRSVWLVHADRWPPQLEPHAAARAAARAAPAR